MPGWAATSGTGDHLGAGLSMDKANVIQRACRAAAAGQEFAARELLRAYYL